MRKFLVFLSAVLIALPVSAQDSKAPKPKVVAKAGDKPDDTPKRSVIGRIFGRKPAPTPAPAPAPAVAAPTSAPKKTKSHPRQKSTPAEKPEGRGEEADPAETTKPKPAADPEVKPPTTSKRTGKKNTPPPPSPVSGDVDEKTRYTTARAKAEEDAAIKELKSKADEALTEAEAHSTSVSYNRAVYKKIRELDPSLDEYVNRLEEVMMKRLNSEKKAE